MGSQKKYQVQMEEIVVNDDFKEVVDVWDGFFACTANLKEAKRNANKLIDDIRHHNVQEVFEVCNPDHTIGVNISVYKKDSVDDVIEVGELSPGEWNLKCGDCGAYCDEGVCSKYNQRVEENRIADNCWHQ